MNKTRMIIKKLFKFDWWILLDMDEQILLLFEGAMGFIVTEKREVATVWEQLTSQKDAVYVL